MPERDEKCADCSSSGLSFAPNSGKSSAAKEPCSWFEIHYLVKEVARQAGAKKYDCILAIANGGIIPARLLAEELGIDDVKLVPVRKKKIIAQEMPALDKKKRYLIIDDIYDTGDTYRKVSKAVKGFSCDYAFCMTRRPTDAGICGRILGHDRWIVFPWERTQ
ncbi:MAG: phosphoribosyltransferase [Nitrososphaera sp.]|uniref:phosphoribosyltransferase n=1 Tax=Nitrososphaera sp. TaxID=1971748 RepID=UPI003D70182D